MRFDIDKFRPLVNYLKREADPGRIIKTSYKNVLLLAWLIKFNKHSGAHYPPTAPPAAIDSQIAPHVGQEIVVPLLEKFPAYLDDMFAPDTTANRFPRIAFKQIIVEYPSGVRITVEGCELSHISQLAQLA